MAGWHDGGMAECQDVRMSSTNPRFGSEHDGDHPDRADEWARLRQDYLRPKQQRPASTARGVHHEALLSSDVARTIDFYQGLLEFPLTDLFENRDYAGLDALLLRHRQRQRAGVLRLPRPRARTTYEEVLGGHHHLAISVERGNWARLRAKLDAAGVAYLRRRRRFDLLRRPGRRTARTDLRPPRRDVRQRGRLTDDSRRPGRQAGSAGGGSDQFDVEIEGDLVGDHHLVATEGHVEVDAEVLA